MGRVAKEQKKSREKSLSIWKKRTNQKLTDKENTAFSKGYDLGYKAGRNHENELMPQKKEVGGN